MTLKLSSLYSLCYATTLPPPRQRLSSDGPLGHNPTMEEPTPFQRDFSDAHHKRLADVINKTDGYG
jgi:hypothetical protein